MRTVTVYRETIKPGSMHTRQLTALQVSVFAYCLENHVNGRCPAPVDIKRAMGWPPNRQGNAQAVLFQIERHGLVRVECDDEGRFKWAELTAKGLAYQAGK